jgi:hypothetical protein
MIKIIILILQGISTFFLTIKEIMNPIITIIIGFLFLAYSAVSLCSLLIKKEYASTNNKESKSPDNLNRQVGES